MQYGSTITTEFGFGEAVERTRAALADNGFGILTEIDVQATLKRLNAALQTVAGA